MDNLHALLLIAAAYCLFNFARPWLAKWRAQLAERTQARVDTWSK
jgi:hypothetical protein